MALLKEKVAGEAKKVLQEMSGPVSLTYYTQEMECEPCASMSLFIDELSALEGQLKVKKKDFLADGEEARQTGVHHIPALLLHRPEDNRAAVRYYGMPGGYEFGAFLRTIVLFSTGRFDQPIDRESLDLIEKDINLKVFVLTGCPSCPVMAYLGTGLAFLSPRVTTEIIEANTFIDLSTRFSVGTVPKIIINDSTEIVGVLPPEELVKRLIAP